MRTIISITMFILTLAGNPAMAQFSLCRSKVELLAIVTGPTYREDELIVLHSPPGNIHLYGNMITRSWTLISFPHRAPNIACLLGAGNKIELSKLPKKGTDL